MSNSFRYKSLPYGIVAAAAREFGCSTKTVRKALTAPATVLHYDILKWIKDSYPSVEDRNKE